MRVILMTVIALLLVGVILIEFNQHRELRAIQKHLEILDSRAEDAQRNAFAALSAVVTPEMVEAAQPSVYLIVVNGRPRATAFVVDQENGKLATAAHSAESLPLDDPDATIYLTNRTGARRIPIIDRKLHAGFGAFRELVEDYQPIRKNSSILRPQVARFRDLAFDAALLSVEPVDPETGDFILGPSLPIASEEKLLTLKAGAPIAVIGYPYDTLDDGFSADAAISRVERGVVAAMTPPLDTIEDAHDPAIANLVIHRLATAGGNSGSPILNALGEVIGIHTHGIEATSSNADGAAQRAEVLYDLFDETRENTRLNELFLPSWRQRLTHWARADEALPASFYMEHKTPQVSPTPLVGEVNFEDAPYLEEISAMRFGEETEIFRAPAQRGANTPDADDSKNFVIEDPGQFSMYWVDVDRRQETVLFAFDYSLRAGRGFCLLDSYIRKENETKLRVRRNSASFELFLPTDANAGIESYHIVLRRNSNCDRGSNEFFSGAIQWSPTAEIETAAAGSPVILGVSVPSMTPPQKIENMWNSLSDWFVCDARKLETADRCEELEFISLADE